MSVGAVEDLSTGIAHLDAAVAACPRGSRELPGLANNLANALRRRFHRLREITDLDAAIEQLQHALDATDTDSVNRPGLHRKLAAALTDAQQAVLAEGGTSTDFADDAITAAQSAAEALPREHPDHDDVQEILAGAWLQRALTTHHKADFDHAVTAARAALAVGDEHASTLANCLVERFNRFRDDTDRAEAATRYRRIATDPARAAEVALRDARNWGSWNPYPPGTSRSVARSPRHPRAGNGITPSTRGRSAHTRSSTRRNNHTGVEP